MTEFVTYYTPDISKNLAALSAYLGTRLMLKREFFAAFFYFKPLFLMVLSYTHTFCPKVGTQSGAPNIRNVLAQVI